MDWKPRIVYTEVEGFEITVEEHQWSGEGLPQAPIYEWNVRKTIPASSERNGAFCHLRAYADSIEDAKGTALRFVHQLATA